jgi:sugar transferase (PEP-CTERM system associated)
VADRCWPAITAARCLVLFDVAFAALGWGCAVAIAGSPIAPLDDPWPFVLFPACFLLLLCAFGLFRRDALLELHRSLGRASVAAAVGPLVALALCTFPWRGDAVRPDIPALLAPAALSFLVSALAARALLFALRRRGAFRQRLLVIGAGARAWDLVWLLRREGRAPAYSFVFVHDRAMGPVDARITEQGPIFDSKDGFLPLARKVSADRVVVAPDDRRGLDMQALLACKVAGFPVHTYLDCLEQEIGRVDVKRLELGWLLYADGFRFSPLDRLLKRGVDIVTSLLALLFASPFLLAAAIAVKAEDRGPILYRQARVTEGGRVFQILKLRSMRTDAERAGAVWAKQRDARVTRVGRVLRRSRLDELPQLLNVLRGDMSLVGPRPERSEFIRELARSLPLYSERHLVKAGLTGWAQINYPYGASLDDARSKLSYDLHYVKNCSILFDLLIMLQTAQALLWPTGVR